MTILKETIFCADIGKHVWLFGRKDELMITSSRESEI